MSHDRAGRVKLAKFYGAALDGEWRFSESTDYLRQLGTLDESSQWQGPRVIVTNYMQAPSNCIITAQHYRVCCANECEDHLHELEERLQAPSAPPEKIFPIISELLASSESARALSSSLRSQLAEVARVNDGQIPLHGRLFTQWLHYVFPLECPFPHKAGTTTISTPLQFGQDYMATEEELLLHSGSSVMDFNATAPSALDQDHIKVGEEDEFSLWSHEEELISGGIRTPWNTSSVPQVGLLLLLGLLIGFAGFWPTRCRFFCLADDKHVLPTRMKVHHY